MTVVDAAAPEQELVGHPPAADRAGRIESHGIDHIPEAERHGTARSLVMVWAASNITYLYIVLGGALILFGLDVVQALAVVVAGNLLWALVGLLAVSGPSAGTPSEIITRAMFGVRGNRAYNAVLGWLVGVAYEAINLSIGALAGFALVTHLGGHVAVPVKLAIVLATAAVTFTISVYGHATIVRLSPWFTAALLGSSVVLGWCVVRRAHLGYHPTGADAPHGGLLWATIGIGVTLIASSPLSWGTGADYARYLPSDTSPTAVAAWTALGGFVPAVALGTLGVLAGTVVNMTDPQTSLKAILPGWFYPLFLFVIIVGSITNNVLTAYSTGLSLQAVGIPWRRAVTVLFDAAVAIGVTAYALLISDFLDTLNNILALSVAILGPALTVYGADILLRRNRYDAEVLHDERHDGPIWFWHGVNPAGAIALIAGTVAAALCVDSTLFVGPISRSLDGADLSAVAGPLVAAAVYVPLFHRGRRRAAAAPPPRGAHFLPAPSEDHRP